MPPSRYSGSGWKTPTSFCKSWDVRFSSCRLRLLEPHFRERFAALMPKLRRACDFIQKGYPTIIVKVGHTPNRLLIAAKAFGLCGIVLDDESMKENSSRLVKAALARRDRDGVFIERSGRDSSYNAVSILMGQHLSLYLPNAELDAALKPAMDWQRTRIKPTGEVEVEGNTPRVSARSPRRRACRRTSITTRSHKLFGTTVRCGMSLTSLISRSKCRPGMTRITCSTRGASRIDTAWATNVCAIATHRAMLMRRRAAR